MSMVLGKKWKLAKNQRGMTLIELMAVVVILGILATIAGVAVVNASKTAKINADTTTVSVLKDAAQRYLMDKEVNEDDLKDEDKGIDIRAIDLINGLYLRDIPKDSAGNEFKALNVKVTKGTIEWIFSTTDPPIVDNFAPKSTHTRP